MTLCSIKSSVFLSLITVVFSEVSQKCCAPGQAILSKNLTLSCQPNPGKRVQTNFEKNDFVSTNSAGACAEVYAENKTAIFEVNAKGEISLKETLNVVFYPKCCHLNHVYNESLHSCQASTEMNVLETNIPNNSFIFVGLPTCEIIADVFVSDLEEIELTGDNLRFKKDNRSFGKGEFCIDSTVLGAKFVVRVCEDYQVCERIRCVRKCCYDGQSFVNGSKCKDTFRYGVDLHGPGHFEKPDVPFAIIHGIEKPISILTDRNAFTIKETGTFSIYSNKTGTYRYFPPSEPRYCLEHAYKKGKVNGYTLFSKSWQAALPTKFAVTRWIKILSCIFLFLTMLVYLLLPKMLNLFGKILLSYSFATFLFFFFLCLSQFLSTQYSDVVCKTIGFLTIMTTMCSFTWLNIMCIDIWASFGSPRTFSGPLQKNELKKLCQYSLYGWGFPLIWILLIVLFEATTMLPEVMHPYVGFKRCFMEKAGDRTGNYAYIIFITLPVAVQQIGNIVLFVKTIIYCLKIRGEIQKMNESSKKNYRVGKEELHLVMKLAVIMGVSFLFETVSSVYDFSRTPFLTKVEVVWDTINCLQGVFIFVVFICKRKILNDLVVKLGIKKTSRYEMTSSMATQDSLHSHSVRREAMSLR